MWVTEHCHRLPRDVVELLPSLDIFKTHLDMVLGKQPCVSRSLDHMDLRCFNQSAILCLLAAESRKHKLGLVLLRLRI